MGKMKELDQLFREIGDDVLQEERYRNPNHTYRFLENYQGYTYFWERKSMRNIVFNEELKRDETFTENYIQFALLVDFSKSQFKCMYKGWDLFYKYNSYSEPENKFEDIIESNDFDTFISDLIYFLARAHNNTEYSLIHDVSILRRLSKLIENEE